jgi:hypothetical protein
LISSKIIGRGREMWKKHEQEYSNNGPSSMSPDINKPLAYTILIGTLIFVIIAVIVMIILKA